MRLTLRTLLAYLDDVLDPADKDELSQKIESSEFAEDLVHRTRDTMRRLRLSAPQVIGTGVALDPNTVAEYLDNVLPPEQVGDFERICLESDVHLAEAAACHHVLTMVLGEPADVEPRARQRMYGVPAEARERKRVRVEAAHGPAGAGAKPQAAATMPISHQPTAPIAIPEYLRTGLWWQSRGALAALAVVTFVGITLYLASGLMGWFGGAAQTGGLSPDKTEEPAVALEASDQGATSDAGGDRSTESAAVTPLPPPPQPLTPGIAPPVVDTIDEPDRYAILGETSAVESGQETAPIDTDAAEFGAAISADVSDPTAVEPDRYAIPARDPSAAIPPAPVDGEVSLPSEPGVRADDVSDAERLATPQDSEVGPGIAPEAIASEEVPAGPREVGTYLGGKTVLLRYDDEAGAWFRVEPRDAVVAGQQLVSLPEFRPKVTLASGLHMDISGGTQIAVREGEQMQAEGLPAMATEEPAIEVVYGRIVLINTSMEENRVRLKTGPMVGDAQLARNATLAVEVERQHVAGNDPRQTPSPVVVRLFAPDGGVTWSDESGELVADAPSRWTIEAGQTSAVIPEASLPEWIDQEPGGQSSEQRFGAPVVESTLVSNRPADIQLLELFQGSTPRREVKSLVTRASIHVGLFEPFVEALRDSEQRANWKSHVEALRSAMALSPESAKKVWQALVAQRGERAAAELYEMLCGYNADEIGRTPDQRKTGALARLIDWLEEDSLDYRVLAVHDLAEITGKRLMSNPAAAPAERALSVRRWRTRLESDELRPVGQE